jgi:hypothetical protein
MAHLILAILCLIALLKLCAPVALFVLNADKGTYDSVINDEDSLIDSHHTILYITKSNGLFHFLVIIAR